MLSSASSAPDTTSTNHPIMSISSLLEPSSTTSDHVSSTFMRQDSHCIPPPPLVLPPMVSPTTTSSHHEDDEMLLPPLDKTLFTSSSSSSSGGSRSPSPDPRDIPTSSLEERRRRNKIASAKYRAKRSQENKNMRQALEHLRRQNAVLLQALNDVYRDKSNMGDAAAAEHPPSSWPLLTFTSAAPGTQGHDDGNIHCATHTYPTMSL